MASLDMLVRGTDSPASAGNQTLIANYKALSNLIIMISFLTTAKQLLVQCFSTAGPRPCTGPWRQLHRAAKGSPGICHFSFLSIFHE